MKIIVDMEDFWLEEDKSLEEALKSQIIDTAIQKIKESIKEKVENEIDVVIKTRIESFLHERIIKIVDDVVKNEKVKPRYSEKESTIAEYIVATLKEKVVNRDVSYKIEEYASEYVKELKNRYDMEFASRIVLKMKENDLLKEGVSKKLLENREVK